MNFLFIHQNFPGQFKHVAAALAASPKHKVIALADENSYKGRPSLHPNIITFTYPSPAAPNPNTHPYIREYERAIRQGQAVVRLLLDLKRKGFSPDVVVAHPGWGEALFLKDVYPNARHVNYFEFYYRADGSDVGFDPEFPSQLDDHLRLRIKNSTQLISLDAADCGVSPTQWQKSQYPIEYANKIKIIHDGIDTSKASPDPNAKLTIGSNAFRVGDEIVTYVARNLEPYRGFHRFMRILPNVLSARPKAHIIIIGGNEISYGQRHVSGKTYRQALLDELTGQLDQARMHWLGRVPYDLYLTVLRLSKVHVYLTYPFVLSWSLLEAMSCKCTVVASNTSPVQEVIKHGYNGLLVDFFDEKGLASSVIDALSRPKDYSELRAAARNYIIDHFDLRQVCLPQITDLLLARCDDA